MKRLCVLVVVVIFMLIGANAQTCVQSEYGVEPVKLEVAYSKTTNLIFPLPIVSIDRGSNSILAKKANGVQNILRVRANRKKFDETNLTVITSDGLLYSFVLTYNENPVRITIGVKNDADDVNPNEEVGLFNKLKNNSSDIGLLKKYSLAAAFAKPSIRAVNSQKDELHFSLNGYYVHDNLMFCRISLENRSSISFNIDHLRLYIKDRKQPKRTARQEKEIEPIYILGDTDIIEESGKINLVIALPKFTIPHGKYLFLEFIERNGARHPVLRIKASHVMKAKSL
jgi:conjugative transposon TraN protein